MNIGKKRYIGGLIVGALLILAVVQLSKLSLDEVAHQLTNLPIEGLAGLLGIFLFIILFSGQRWSMIVAELSSVSTFQPFFFTYNILLSQLARLLPGGHITGLGAKVLSLRYESGVRLEHGLFSGALEALINLYAILLLVIFASIVHLMPTDLTTGLISGGCAVLFFAGAFIFGFQHVQRLLPGFLNYIEQLFQRFTFIQAPLQKARDVTESATLTPRILSKLIALSLATYLLGILHTYMLARIMDMNVDILIFFKLYPLMMLISIIGIIPAGLGLLEAGWAGLLTLSGVPAPDAASYSIIRRIVGEGCVFALFVPIYALYKFSDRDRKVSIEHE